MPNNDGDFIDENTYPVMLHIPLETLMMATRLSLYSAGRLPASYTASPDHKLLNRALNTIGTSRIGFCAELTRYLRAASKFTPTLLNEPKYSHTHGMH